LFDRRDLQQRGVLSDCSHLRGSLLFDRRNLYWDRHGRHLLSQWEELWDRPQPVLLWGQRDLLWDRRGRDLLPDEWHNACPDLHRHRSEFHLLPCWPGLWIGLLCQRRDL